MAIIVNAPAPEAGSPLGSGKGNTAYVFLISLVAAMGGLLFGWDWVVVGGAEPFYEAFFDLTDPYLIGWAMSAALIGCLVGSIASGVLSDAFGRKKLLIASAVLFAVSSVATALAGSFINFVVWRIIGGVAIGMASNLSPMYIAEVAPAALRGRLVALNQLTIVIGILAAQIANMVIADKVDPQLYVKAQAIVASADAQRLQDLARQKASQLEAALKNQPGALTNALADSPNGTFTNQFWILRRGESSTPVQLGGVPELLGDAENRKIEGGTLASRLRELAKTNGVLFLTVPKSEKQAEEQVPRVIAAAAIPGTEGNVLCASFSQDAQQVLKQKLSLIRETDNGKTRWRWMFAAVAAPSLLFLICSLFVPESPRWLVKNGHAEKARQILARISGAVQADTAVKQIQDTLASQEIQRVRFQDLLDARMLKILFVGCALAVLQQWSGINVLFNYATQIFQEAGYGVSDSLAFIVVTGIVNLLFTLIAMGMVDRQGRRGLMLFGCAGIGLSHLLIGVAYNLQLKGLFVLFFTLMALGWYAMSLAPVTWVLISEIFPNRIRGAAISVAVSALWIACFILTFTFPLLKKHIGMANTFWVYAAICAVGFVFIKAFVPETKGKSLEQIEKELVD